MSLILFDGIRLSGVKSSSGKYFVQFQVIGGETARTCKDKVTTTWPMVSVNALETARLQISVYGRRWFLTYRKLRHTREVSVNELSSRSGVVKLQLFGKDSQDGGSVEFSMNLSPLTPHKETQQAKDSLALSLPGRSDVTLHSAPSSMNPYLTTAGDIPEVTLQSHRLALGDASAKALPLATHVTHTNPPSLHSRSDVFRAQPALHVNTSLDSKSVESRDTRPPFHLKSPPSTLIHKQSQLEQDMVSFQALLPCLTADVTIDSPDSPRRRIHFQSNAAQEHDSVSGNLASSNGAGGHTAASPVL